MNKIVQEIPKSLLKESEAARTWFSKKEGIEFLAACLELQRCTIRNTKKVTPKKPSLLEVQREVCSLCKL